MKMAKGKTLIVLGNSVSADIAAGVESLSADGSAETVASSIANFASGEPFSELFYGEEQDHDANAEKLKGADVWIVQSTDEPVADHAMQLLFAVQTAKRYGAASVNLVMPFAAFARQDREFEGRFASVAGEDFPKLLKTAGVDRVVTAEMHSRAAENFYSDIFGADNVTFLSAAGLFSDSLKNAGYAPESVVIGAPDGADKPHDRGQERARDVRTAYFGADAADEDGRGFKIWKEHTGVNDTKVSRFEGDVDGRVCVIVDDMGDSGGTLINAGKVLKDNGASEVVCCITHGILSGKALEKILTRKAADGGPAIDRLVVSDTIPSVHKKIDELARQYPGIQGRVEVVSLAADIKDAVLAAQKKIAPRQVKDNRVEKRAGPVRRR